MALGRFSGRLPTQKRTPRSGYPVYHLALPRLCHIWDKDCCAILTPVYGCCSSDSYDRVLARTRRSSCDVPAGSTCTWETGRRGCRIPLTPRGLSRSQAHAAEHDSFSLLILRHANFQRRDAVFFSLSFTFSPSLYVFAFYPLVTTLLCFSLALPLLVGRSLLVLVRHFVSTGVPCPLLSDVHLFQRTRRDSRRTGRASQSAAGSVRSCLPGTNACCTPGRRKSVVTVTFAVAVHAPRQPSGRRRSLHVNRLARSSSLPLRRSDTRNSFMHRLALSSSNGGKLPSVPSFRRG